MGMQARTIGGATRSSSTWLWRKRKVFCRSNPLSAAGIVLGFLISLLIGGIGIATLGGAFGVATWVAFPIMGAFIGD